jgi:hypothetical protein
MKKVVFIIIMLFITFITFINVNSQDIVEDSVIYKPFDIALVKLPDNYKGCDIIRLYEKLKNIIPAKDEFETIKEYKNKIQKIKLSIPDYNIAFSTGSSLYRGYNIGFSCNYNAEKNVFDFDITSSDCIEIINENDYYGIKYRDNYPQYKDPMLKFEVGISLDEAKVVKNHLKILYIGKIKLYNGDDLIKYTFTLQQSNIFKYIFFDLKEIWVYNSLNGKIYYKEKVEYPLWNE